MATTSRDRPWARSLATWDAECPNGRRQRLQVLLIVERAHHLLSRASTYFPSSPRRACVRTFVSKPHRRKYVPRRTAPVNVSNTSLQSLIVGMKN